MYMSKEGKSFDYNEKKGSNAYKFIGNTVMQAVLTNNLYGDFVGKVSVITDGDTEWSVFAGFAGTDYKSIKKDYKEALEHIAKSLRPDNTPPEEETTYAVTVGNKNGDSKPAENEGQTADSGEKTEVSDQPAVSSEVNAETSGDTEITVADNDAENIENTTDNNEVDTAEPHEAQAVPEAEEITENEQDTAENAQEEKQDEAQKESQKEDVTKQEPEEDPADGVKETGINLSNQNKQTADENNTYESDIYSMLNIGDTGKFDVISDNGHFEECKATLKAIYIGDTAMKTVRDKGEYNPVIEAGCSLNVAKIHIDYSGMNDTPAVDVRFEGLDGKNLKHLGIAYTSRTHTLTGKDTGTGTYYFYYSVPVGCRDYALSLGSGNDENGGRNAYFHVKY